MSANMFTIEQYIKDNKLDVNPKDVGATRLVAEHLKRLGFRMRRIRSSEAGVRVSTNMWARDDRKEELDALKEKLGAIEQSVKGKKK